jgi:hypothetical protein
MSVMIAQDDYSFQGLRAVANDDHPDLSLIYVVGLVDSPSHKISETEAAKPILRWLYDIEEQVPNAYTLLREQESFTSRYFRGGYFPLTPCMVVKRWSPMGAMLDRGLRPVVLRREQKILATAAGIWEPQNLEGAKQIGESHNYY